MSDKPMTGKDVLKRIAPIAITLVLIVLIAIVITSVKGCSNKTPTIDNAEDTYLELGDLKITNDRLYTYLKQEYGLAELNRLVDEYLYAEDIAKVDSAKLDAFIIENIFGEDGLKSDDGEAKKATNKETWEDLINSLLMNNLIKQSEVTEDAKDPYNTTSKVWDVVRSYYKLQYARREWAKNAYVEKLRAERKEASKEGLFDEEDFEEYYEANYSETATVIIIPFTSEEAAYKAMNNAGINTTTSMLNSTIAKKGWVSKDYDYNSNTEITGYLSSIEVYKAFIQMYNDVYTSAQIEATDYTQVVDEEKSLQNALDKLSAAIEDIDGSISGNIVLPTTVEIKDFDKDATIEWSVEEGATCLKLEGNKLVYTSPETETEVKVTAKISLQDGPSKTKVYTFEVHESEEAAAEETLTVEAAEAFQKLTFDTKALSEKGVNLVWDIKTLSEVNATLAKKVIYVSEDASSTDTLVIKDGTDFVKSYTMKPISAGNYYFLALKAHRTLDHNLSDKKAEIEAELIEELFAENDNNIDRMIYQRRMDAGLAIYDRYLEALYDYQYTYFYETTLKETNYTKYEDSKKKENKVVAKFTVNGSEKEITADDLYKSLCEKYAASVSIDLINEYRVVSSSFNDLYNPYTGKGEGSDTYKELLETEIGGFRKNFEADYFTYSYLSYYGFIPNFPAKYGWKNFQKDYFGAYSDEELLVNANFGGSVYSYALDKLTKSLYTDVTYSLTDDENKATDTYKAMLEAYNEWYGLNVVNLIVGVDADYNSSFDTQEYVDAKSTSFGEENEVWTKDQKELAKKLMTLIQEHLSETGKSTVYAQLEEIVKVYNNASYVEETRTATADDTIYTFNYFAEYKRAGLVLKLESSQAYDNSSSLVPEFLDALEGIYKDAIKDGAETTFAAPYSATCETTYGFHLIYALSLQEKVELPEIEDIAIYNLLQEITNNANSTLEYKVAAYDAAIKALKDVYGIDYETTEVDESGNETTTTYTQETEVTDKITKWYTPAVTEVTGNTLLSGDLINYLKANVDKIKVSSSVLNEATYKELLNIIIKVSEEDLNEANEENE